jgi:hypothetical protein
MNESLPKDTLLLWLGEVLAALNDVNVDIVVEEAADAHSSVQITLRDVPQAIAGLQLRRLA